MKTIKEKCGCQYTAGERQQWVELCAHHKNEADALHERAAAEYRIAAARREAEGFYDKAKKGAKS